MMTLDFLLKPSLRDRFQIKSALVPRWRFSQQRLVKTTFFEKGPLAVMRQRLKSTSRFLLAF